MVTCLWIIEAIGEDNVIEGKDKYWLGLELQVNNIDIHS